MNMAIDGNPGIGKSRSYVNCAFRLIRGCVDEELKKLEYNLILNHDDMYFQYDHDDVSLHQLSNDEIDVVSGKPKVVRLTNETSPPLYGWAG
ncbi:unnamed protein product [Phytophthora lilii]|uniref:Unnamed protein product n=1 Tax=Phytophthora lilii TaxID=2077276 RepID=A0A9W6WYT0_9STRA|nr:unnamed protein product [Phytophthora lilii]